MSNNNLCVCGSGVVAGDCCLPVIQGSLPALTAEQLMRSRYTAYVLGDSDYLLRSWHPETRPPSLFLQMDEVRWTGLIISNIKAGRAGDKKGEVEFIANFIESEKRGQVRENSRFVFEQGQWFYLNGKMGEKTGRNSPCPCGSGKKLKKCCASRS